MSKSQSGNFINKMDYSYETDPIEVISRFYGNIFGSHGVITLPPVSMGTCAATADSHILESSILSIATGDTKKVGFCHTRGGGHWTAVVFSRENGNSTIICNILNSTTFGTRREEEKDAQDIFNSLQKNGSFEDLLKTAQFNGINIKLEHPKIPVYKQTGAVGCGAVALENLRRALYDNQADTNKEQYMEDLAIRNYHEFVYPPLQHLDRTPDGQFLTTGTLGTHKGQWCRATIEQYHDIIRKNIQGPGVIMESIIQEQGKNGALPQNQNFNQKPSADTTAKHTRENKEFKDSSGIAKVNNSSPKTEEYFSQNLNQKIYTGTTKVEDTVNNHITNIAAIIKEADLVDLTICALNDKAVLGDLLLQQPGLSLLKDLTPAEKQELLREMQNTEEASNISQKEPLASKLKPVKANTLDCDAQTTLIEIGEWLINNNQRDAAMSELDETGHWSDLPKCITGSHDLATQLLGNNFEAQEFLLGYLTDGQTY